MHAVELGYIYSEHMHSRGRLDGCTHTAIRGTYHPRCFQLMVFHEVETEQ